MLLNPLYSFPLEIKEQGTRGEPGTYPMDSAKRTHPEEKQGYCNLSHYCSAHFHRTKRNLFQETEKMIQTKPRSYIQKRPVSN